MKREEGGKKEKRNRRMGGFFSNLEMLIFDYQAETLFSFVISTTSSIYTLNTVQLIVRGKLLPILPQRHHSQ